MPKPASKTSSAGNFSALGPRWSDAECEAFFDVFRANLAKRVREDGVRFSAVPPSSAWSEIASRLPGRTPGMCEALFNLNRTILSLPAGAVTAVAFSASMNDQYSKDPELGMTRRESRESTPPPGAHRAVGKRTPRGHPQKKKDVHSPDFDVLEMAGQALVSMSPAPAAARAKSSKSSWDGGSGDDNRAPEAAFGSPAPSPARVKSSKPSDDDDESTRRVLKSSRALFPASSDDDAAGAGPANGVSAATASDSIPAGTGLDDEAFGALDGLFMLADASTKAAKPKSAGGRGKKGKPGGKPPRAPLPKSPARKKGDSGSAATPPRARFSAPSARDALELGLSGPIRGGGRVPGQSRKSALKATQPVRLRDGVAGGGFYRSPARMPPYAYAKNNGKYADPDTPGTAQLTRGLGLLGPRHVEETQLETRLGGGLAVAANDSSRDPPGTPGGAARVAAGGHTVPGTPNTPVNRGIAPVATSFFASTPGVLRGAPSAARRRWFLAEHFYGSIDKPWFRAVGYAPFLKHLGLRAGAESRVAFTKKEWLAIRRALGTPRRLSLPFLRRERVALEKWRAETRDAWARRTPAEASEASRKTPAAAKTEPGADAPDRAAEPKPEPEPEPDEGETREASPVPVDDWNPKPFEVGDRVAARHPRVLNVNTGSILIVRGARHLVQFDRIELGVELVRDINIAHLPHHLDALLLEEEEKEREAAAAAAAKEAAEAAAADADAEPRRDAPAGGGPSGGPVAPAAALAAKSAAKSGKPVAGLSCSEAAKAAAASAIAAAAKAAAAAAARGDADAALLLGDAAGRAPETAEAVAAAAAAAVAAASREGSADGSADAEASAASAHEEDTRALAEVTTALDLKERLVSELRAMNDVAETNARSADAKASVASPGGTVLEPFQRQYASTVLKVRECNAHLQNALAKLRTQHRRRELAGASGAWRRFAPGGGAAARGDGGEIFAPLDDDDDEKNAADAAAPGSFVAPDATLSLTRSNASAEIVAACEFVAARRVREERKADGASSSSSSFPSDSAFAFAARALGALLAVKTCTEHGADETLFREVVDRCLASMAPRSENAEAFEELKSGFDVLRVSVYG